MNDRSAGYAAAAAPLAACKHCGGRGKGCIYCFKLPQTASPAPSSSGNKYAGVVVNGAVCDQGLVVSAARSAAQSSDPLAKALVVDVFHHVDGLQEHVPLVSLKLDLKVELLPTLKARVPGTNVQSSIRNAVEILGPRPVLGEQQSLTSMRWFTWAQIGLRAECLAQVLRNQFPQHCFFGLMARNSVDWVVVFLSIVLGQFVAVPIHENSNHEFVHQIVEQSKMVALFVDEVADLVSVREVPLNELPAMECRGAACIKGGLQCLDDIHSKSPLMVAYTSGSTGRPKGAVLLGSSIHGELCDRIRQKAFSEHSPVLLHNSPLSTSASPANLLGALLIGGRAAFLRDVAQTFEMASVVGPTQMTGPPQLWALLYKTYQARLAAGEEEKTLRREAKTWLGPRIQTINCGGAVPIPSVMQWLQKTFPLAAVTENYGLSETARVTAGRAGELQPILKGVEVRLEDFDTYRSTDSPPRGQVCVKTERMISEYFERPDLTAEAFTPDGFFRTGDIGEMPDSDHLRVIDRIHAFFKLSNGEWVSPESVEVRLVQAPEVKQAFVFGNSTHDQVVAVVVSHESKEVVLAAIERCSQGLRHFEVPQMVHITKDPWVETTGHLTRSGKLCRRALQDTFANELGQMLQSVAKSTASVDESWIVRLVREGADAESWASITWTSVTVVKATEALYREFNVRVPAAAILQGASLEDVVAHIRGHRQLDAVVDWDHEASLETLAFPSGELRPDILLTGATGHVGACVLHYLFSADIGKVSVLLRGESEQSARDKLCKVLQVRGYAEAAIWAKDGVDIVLGDLQQPRLGLREECFNSLCPGCIMHVAAEVDHLRSYSCLKAANVGGTLTLLEMASKSPTRFVHVSTSSAQHARSGYAQSKWVSQRLVEKARERGLHAVILPLGMIGADRNTGAANTSDWLMRFVAGTIELGAFYAPGVLSLTPCEVAAQAVVECLQEENVALESFQIPAVAFMTRIAGSTFLRGRQLKEVSPVQWGEIMQTLPASNPMFPLRHYFLYGLGKGISFSKDCCGYDQASVDRMLAFLDHSGSACPS